MTAQTPKRLNGSILCTDPFVSEEVEVDEEEIEEEIEGEGDDDRDPSCVESTLMLTNASGFLTNPSTGKTGRNEEPPVEIIGDVD